MKTDDWDEVPTNWELAWDNYLATKPGTISSTVCLLEIEQERFHPATTKPEPERTAFEVDQAIRESRLSKWQEQYEALGETTEIIRERNARNGRSDLWGDDIEKLKTMVKAGLSHQEIASRLKRTLHAVQNQCYAHNLTTPRKRWDEAEKEKLKRYFHEGKTYREIGELMNRSPDSVRFKCKQFNLTRKKTKGEN